MIKGYLSFDLSRFYSTSQVYITYAEISFINLERSNHPESFASHIVVKVFDYGNSLDASDYAVGGDNLATIPISAPSYVISNDILIDQLQKAINAEKDYFQLKLGLNSTTNGDNVMDTIDIPSCIEEVWLSIDYNQFQGEEY